MDKDMDKDVDKDMDPTTTTPIYSDKKYYVYILESSDCKAKVSSLSEESYDQDVLEDEGRA